MSADQYSRYETRYAKGSGHRSCTRRTVAIAGIAVACVAVVGAGVATPAMASGVIDDLKTRASSLSSLYREIADALVSGDFAHARTLADQALEEVGAFRKEMEGPLWSLAEILPVYGSDVKAARSLLAMLDNLTADVLVPLSDVLAPLSIDTLVYRDVESGAVWFDVDAVVRVVDVVRGALPQIKRAIGTLNGIGTLNIDQLKSVVEQAREVVAPLEDKLDQIETLLGVVPQILGADGRERTYVIVAQNNVEARSTGGFAGAWCPVHVNGGLVTLGDVTNVYQVIPTNPDYLLEITDVERTVFDGSVSYIPGNAGIIPHFPRVCDLWSQFWLEYQGAALDGVLAVDPIFFQSIVGLLGSVELPDGTVIDGTNAARVLMHDTYWRYMGDGTAMDEFLASAAGAVIDALFDNLSSLDPGGLLDAFEAGIDNGNILIWFADADEEAVVEELGCSGALVYDETRPQLGVYFTNVSWSKIEWWLDEDLQVGDPVSNADGSTSYPVSLTFSNALTWDEVDAADGYILGTNSLKWSSDDILDLLYLYAPAGGSISDIAVNGGLEDLAEAYHMDFQLYYGLMHVQIDGPLNITFTVTTSPRATEGLSVRRTPTCQYVR